MSYYTHLRNRWQLLVLTLGTLLLLCLCACFHDFYTKGEPREALVAVEMLRTGNWILPIDASGDMSYKPPLLHWLICLFSLPGGRVTEFTSRLPSALALTALVAATYLFIKRNRVSETKAWQPLLAALVLLTSFEVFRAGVNCRVDMLLSSLMAIGLMCMWRGGWRSYIAAALLFGGAVLTKGPIGLALPLLLWWIWRLWGKTWRNAGRPTLIALAVAIVALILPALWYWAAFRQGGDRFMELMLEENLGRLTGTMSYESHVKPVWYNFVMLAAGLLPWSALTLLSLLRKPWRIARHHLFPTGSQRLFCLTVVLGVLVFFSIPQSKRSVYLLPLYPFAAVLLADYAALLTRKAKNTGKIATNIALWCAAAYALTYMVVWPIIVNPRSDRGTASYIEHKTGNKPIYTLIHSRLDRFYGIDFYLGARMKALAASGQIAGDKAFDLREVKWPCESIYYVVMTERDWQADFLKIEMELKNLGYDLHVAYLSPRPTRDMRQKLVLLEIAKQQ